MVSVNRPLAIEDVGILGEEAEDQPRHEVIHVVAALGRAPIGVVLQKFDIEPVQAAGRPDVEGVLADLLDGRDARQRQEEAEMVGKVLVGAGDGLAARQVFGLKVRAVGRQDELRFALWRSRGSAFSAVSVFVTCPASQVGDMDIVGLKNAAKVGFVRCASAQPLDRRLLRDCR